MKKLIAIALAVLLLIAASIPVTADTPEWLEPVSEKCQVTGGGWFMDKLTDPSHKVSFEIEAASNDSPDIQERDYGGVIHEVIVWPAEGEFSLLDHTSGQQITGTIKQLVWEESYKPDKRIAEGSAIFNGERYRLAVQVNDGGKPGELPDRVLVELISKGGTIEYRYFGTLEGGNIQVKDKGLEIEL
jgi:hypothetical protein